MSGSRTNGAAIYSFARKLIAFHVLLAVFAMTIAAQTVRVERAGDFNKPRRIIETESTNAAQIIFAPLAGDFTQRQAASSVLGQPDFTSATLNNGGVSAISMANPFHLFYSETTSSLFVADRGNSRVLRFAALAAPTAASVSVSGKVLAGRAGAANAAVFLIGADSVVRKIFTDARGNYQFENVVVGETYILRATVKRIEYAPQVVYVTEEVQNLNFTGD